MLSAYSLLCFYIALQVCESLPASGSTSISKPSYGTILEQDFDKNTALMNQNLHKGVVSIAGPVLKFSGDTVPHLAHLYAILNGVNITPKLAELGKDIYGKLALFVGGVLGNAGVFGSQFAGNGMEVGAAGLESLNKMFEAAAKTGINIGENMADLSIVAGSLGVKLSEAGLTALRDGLLVPSSGSLAVVQRISDTLKTISTEIIFAMDTAGNTITTMLKDGTVKYKNGVLTFKSKQHERAYKAIHAYGKELGKIDILIKGLLSSINLKVSARPLQSSMSKGFTPTGSGAKITYSRMGTDYSK